MRPEALIIAECLVLSRI